MPQNQLEKVGASKAADFTLLPRVPLHTRAQTYKRETARDSSVPRYRGRRQE